MYVCECDKCKDSFPLDEKSVLNGGFDGLSIRVKCSKCGFIFHAIKEQISELEAEW